MSGSAGDALEDSGALEENMECSPMASSRRTRREACTCPYCKDGEGRYAAHHLTHYSTASHSLARGSVHTVKQYRLNCVCLIGHALGVHRLLSL